MLADADAGNVVTAAAAGAEWGYRLLPLLLLLIPLLYMVQELTVRLGIYTGRGHSELIRERFGPKWAWVAAAVLAVGAVGSLATEFTAVAGIGELYGLPRLITLPVAAAVLLLMVGTGSYRRIERAALTIGLVQLAFSSSLGLPIPIRRLFFAKSRTCRLAIDGFCTWPQPLLVPSSILGWFFISSRQWSITN